MVFSRERKLMLSFSLEEAEAKALVEAGLGLPKDLKKAKVVDIERVLGKSKATALRAKLPKEK